jgi:hypothetical protein
MENIMNAIRISKSLAGLLTCAALIGLAASTIAGIVQPSNAPVASCVSVPASASLKGDGITVYIYQNGIPTYVASDVYASGSPGHVYDEGDNLIGVVNAPLTDGTITSGGVAVGFICPSPAYIAYFGG